MLCCQDADDCESDLVTLTQLVSQLEETCRLQPEFTPLWNALQALNKVSETIQQTRREAKAKKEADMLGVGNALDPLPYQREQYPTQPNELSSLAMPWPNDLLDTINDEFQPYGLVRAMEDQISARNWHEDWWHFAEDMM